MATLPSVTPTITETGELGIVGTNAERGAKNKQHAEVVATLSTDTSARLGRNESLEVDRASVHQSVNTFIQRQVQTVLRLSFMFIFVFPADLGSIGAVLHKSEFVRSRLNLLASVS